jgi:hypothetical protein
LTLFLSHSLFVEIEFSVSINDVHQNQEASPSVDPSTLAASVGNASKSQPPSILIDGSVRDASESLHVESSGSAPDESTDARALQVDTEDEGTFALPEYVRGAELPGSPSGKPKVKKASWKSQLHRVQLHHKNYLTIPKGKMFLAPLFLSLSFSFLNRDYVCQDFVYLICVCFFSS